MKRIILVLVLMSVAVTGCIGQSTVYVDLGASKGGMSVVMPSIDYNDHLTWSKYTEDIYVKLNKEEILDGIPPCSSGYIRIIDYDITKTDYQVKVTGHAQISTGNTPDGTKCVVDKSVHPGLGISMVIYGKDGKIITSPDTFELDPSQDIQSFVIQKSIK